MTTFRVSDTSNGRELVVLVYPIPKQPAWTCARAEARDASAAGAAPHFIPGYGWSTWRKNVAVVESTIDELQRLYTAE